MEDKIRLAFAQIQADDALIDDTMTFLRKEAEQRQQKVKRVHLPMRFAAATAMAFLVIGLLSCNNYFTAAAHVNIDINPSIELTLNRFDRVIGTYAFNEEGAKVLSEINLRGKTYGEASVLLLSTIEADGYIANDALISVTVQASSREKEQALCDDLLQYVSENILLVQTLADVEVFPVTAEIWNNAHNCQMSPAKLLAIQELMEVDESATMEDYADASIRQIRRRTQECRNGHTQNNGGNSEFGTQDEQAHGQNDGNGHRHRGGR